MVDFAGWTMPIQYGSIVDEHQATRTAVGLFDISHMGRLDVHGDRAAEFLDRLVTRRIADMKPGQIRYGLVCSAQGGILDDVLVYRWDGDGERDSATADFKVVVNASNRAKIVEWFSQHQQEFGVRVVDATLDTAMIAVQGPRGIEIADPICECELTSIRYYRGRAAKVLGHDCYVSRTGYTGEDGCEIICPSSAAVEIWERLVEGAEEIGGRVVGLGARDTLRLEAGMPLYGHELSENITPLQAGLDFAVNLEGREFFGRDAMVAAQKENRPMRVGLQLEGRRAARDGCPVLQDGQPVGTVTSGTFSPTFERPLAMAFLKPTATAIGTPLEVDVRGTLLPATVVPLPFYQRGK